MKPDAKHYVFDFDRIFLGNLPWTFLVEVALRTAIIYVFALLVVRVLGKRGMGQLAPFDFVIIIALGSAVGDPMFYPDLPLLHSMIAIIGVVALTRGLVRLTRYSPKVNALVDSTPTRLIVDGRLDLQGLGAEGIARDELFDSLRTAGMQQLGQVERAYLEPSGKLSVFPFPPSDVRPGLPCFPIARRGTTDRTRNWSVAGPRGWRPTSPVRPAARRSGSVRPTFSPPAPAAKRRSGSGPSTP